MEISPELAARADQIRAAIRDIETVRAGTLAQRKEIVLELRQLGLSLAEVSKLVGVSTARVQKIADGNAPPKRKRDTPEQKRIRAELRLLDPTGGW